MSQKVVIIGNGAAGISAAQEIHAIDPTTKILLFGEEGKPYYYRASLSEWLSGKNSADMLLGRTKAFYSSLNIEFNPEHIERIDPEKKIAASATNNYPYDQLLIATGAAANRITIPGIENSLVYRDWQDTLNLKTALTQNNRILILGGGVLGLELASALHAIGNKEIAIIQRSADLGKPLLDAAVSQWLTTRMKSDGIQIFFNDSITRAEENTAFLKSGEKWRYDILIQTIGVSPVYPEVSGLLAEGGIQIDQQCATNLPNIFAAGDCTAVYNQERQRWLPTRIWLDSAVQGKIAGRSMLGEKAVLPERAFFNASYIYSDRYVFIGEPHGNTGETLLWKTTDAYRKFRIKNGKLVGALLINNRQGNLAILQAIENGIEIQAIPEIAQPHYPWNEHTGNNWDYRFY